MSYFNDKLDKALVELLTSYTKQNAIRNDFTFKEVV